MENLLKEIIANNAIEYNKEESQDRAFIYVDDFINELKSKFKLLNLHDVSVSLLKKYMSQVFDCEGVDYVDEIGCGWSPEEFSYEEIKMLKKLSEELGNAR